MKIDVNSPAYLLSVNQGAQPPGPKNSAPGGSAAGDHVTVGSGGTLVASLAAEAMQTPPTRQDRIAQLRQAINGGTYTLDPHAIADGIIKNGE